MLAVTFLPPGPPASAAARAFAAAAEAARPIEPVAAIDRDRPGPQDAHRRAWGQRDSQTQASARGDATAPMVAGPSVDPGRLAWGPTAASTFIAQQLGQESRSTSDHALLPLRAAGLGSDAYRRAGGEPPVYGDRPVLFRLSV